MSTSQLAKRRSPASEKSALNPNRKNTNDNLEETRRTLSLGCKTYRHSLVPYVGWDRLDFNGTEGFRDIEVSRVGCGTIGCCRIDMERHPGRGSRRGFLTRAVSFSDSVLAAC